jgi:methyl-accepting chemotaxis protein
MFVKMKTGTKVIIGFGIAIAIMVVVGVVGYRGIDKVGGHVKALGNVRMRNLYAVNLMDRGQNGAVTALWGLANARTLDPNARSSLFKKLADSLKQADDGRKIFESLPHKPGVTDLWNEFLPLWESWKVEVQKEVDLFKEKDTLLAAGVRPDDTRIMQLDEETYKRREHTREVMIPSSKKLNETIELLVEIGTKDVAEAEADSSFSSTTMFIAIACGVISMALLGYWIARNINKVLRSLIGETVRLSQAAVEGQLTARGNPDLVAAEFKPIVTGFNETLDAVIVPLNVAANYVEQISQGNLPEIITDNYRGDFNAIKNNLNQCIRAIHAMVEDATMLAQAGVEGRLSTRADAGKHRGDFHKIIQGVNDTLDAVIGPLNMAAEYVNRISSGNIPEKITDDYRGDFNAIKNNLNRCIDAINGLIREAKTLSQAALNGELNVRADDSNYLGDYREIIRGMNATLQGFATPMHDIAAALKRMANKDFSRPIEANYPGEYGKLRNDVNEMVTNIRSAIEQINESASQFAEGSRVIAESSQTLASGAQSQSASVEEMSASIEELARSVDAVKENATQATKVANEANHLAEDGGKAVQKSVESMELIRTSSQQISEIIQVISEIASQTNLLALNAAIEAARAGEHGMGFAVVADEVRKLAERSNQAAREISTLIKESTKRVEEGAQLSNQTGNSLQQIIAAAEATAAKISEIATATVEQAVNAQEVSKAIQNISQVTEQSAAGSEEMASSSEELGAQSSALRDLVGAFNVGSSNF